MGFANNAYAKVWEVRENRIRISTSYRKKDGQFADAEVVDRLGDDEDIAELLIGKLFKKGQNQRN